MGEIAYSSTDTIQSGDLLRRVDSLRELNIGDQIGLPQAKSLTGIPFPRDANLCTRYATQITLRRSDKYKITVNVQPGPRSSEEHARKLKRLKFSNIDHSLFKENFADILQTVNEAMGIAAHADSLIGTVFSQDVLKIEITGPTEDCLTIIDVPGLFRVVEGNITEQDAAMVRDMVTKYIQDKRTVILAVIPCNVDAATQEILNLARKHDPKGVRTLGILTKPDLAHEQSMKNSICSLVNNEKHRLTLGYYLVRNRGADDTDPSGHSPTSLDSFFNASPWNTLPRSRVGIHALRMRLGQLLLDLTAQEFSGVKQDLQKRLRTLSEQEKALGVPRSTEMEQRLMLIKVAKEFEEIKRDAMEAIYTRRIDFEEKPQLRLITRLMELSDEFRDCFVAMGQKWKFASAKEVVSKHAGAGNKEDKSTGENLDKDESESDTKAAEKSSNKAAIDTMEEMRQLEQRFSRITDLVGDVGPVTAPEDNIMMAIEEVYSKSRGRDIGGYRGGIIAQMFYEQSSKWGSIARLFVAKALVIVHEFIIEGCKTACFNADVCENLLAFLEKSLEARYAWTVQQVEFLEDIERKGPLFTLSYEYSSLHNALRLDMSKQMIKQQIGQHKDATVEKSLYENTLMTIIEASDAQSQTLQDIYSQLEAYYKVVARSFIDNVWKQAVEYGLVGGKEAPLELFSQEWVAQLSAENLREIAQEPLTIKEERESLARQKKDVRQAIEMLRR
ncbi:hypothetical protein TD95_003985 [Thielaviopsis punctulata]|uniref:GED domain-containing protein n=1 Tax=Thielaviopsis punctulata TaxID=72032 RepID=A0A0F4Z689_9PEZI|nr:hypothetical protein TD95_003985 [Thielaviopsis punctulata]